MDRRPLLSIDGVQKNFGGLVVLDGVSFEAYSDETLCLIGPNGAGKTTLFNIIAGRLRLLPDASASMGAISQGSGRTSAAAWGSRALSRSRGPSPR